jgi:hypothetical protein
MDKEFDDYDDMSEAEARAFFEEARAEVEQAEADHYRQMSLGDFVAYPHTSQYIDMATGNMWPARGVDRKLPPMEEKGEKKPIPASLWLDRHNYVTQIAWVPGEAQFLENTVIRDGGLSDCAGHAIYNSYLPPTIDKARGDKRRAIPWLKHVALCFSEEDAFHILGFLAHAVQRPFEKINHVAVARTRDRQRYIAGAGASSCWPVECAEVSPEQFMGRFNGFAKSVLLRINEAKDLGGTDGKSRFAFYDRMKLCPPRNVDIAGL